MSKGGFTRKSDAYDHIPYLKIALNSKDHNEAVRVISFCDLYVAWSDKKFNGQLGKPISKNTQTAYKIAFKRCAPLYEYKDFRQIHFAEMQDVVDCLVSYDTQKDVKELLNQMTVFAMKYEWCEKNYACLLDLTNYKKPEKDAFTDAEVDALWHDYLGIDTNGSIVNELKHPFTGYVLIMIYCGLRFGELSTIRIENIDLEAREMMGGIKSELSKMTPIVISEEIYPVIKEKYELGGTKLLHMNEDNFYSAYYETCRRSEIRELNPHCCRHTFITRMTRAGIPVAIIQKAARHTRYETTLGYTHMNMDDVKKAINELKPIVPGLGNNAGVLIDH